MADDKTDQPDKAEDDHGTGRVGIFNEKRFERDSDKPPC